MGRKQNEALRAITQQEQQELQRVVKATSERVDRMRRAKSLLAVARGATWTEAGQQAGMSRQAVAKVVTRFNAHGLPSLSIARGRGRKASYQSAERQRILQEQQRDSDREEDGTATWSLSTLQRTLRQSALPRVGTSTIRRVLQEAGYRFGRTRTWCATGSALRKRKAGVVTVYDPRAQEKQRLIELAYLIGEQAGLQVWCQDEAGPYQAIPQAGSTWHRAGHPKGQPHEYTREGTAKLLTLFRPATGQVRAKGVLSAPNAVLHPWLQAELAQVLEPIKRQEGLTRQPTESERARGAQWRTWLWPHESDEGLPPLRILLVWDNLAGHLSHELMGWLFQQGIMPLYTPLGGSWLNMAESVQRIIVGRALSGQHPKDAQEVIDWLEQTVAGWNQHPTPFVWAGKRHQRRERAKLRRLAGSGAAASISNLIAA